MGPLIRCGMFVLRGNTEMNGKSAIVFLYGDRLILGIMENSRSEIEGWLGRRVDGEGYKCTLSERVFIEWSGSFSENAGSFYSYPLCVCERERERKGLNHTLVYSSYSGWALCIWSSAGNGVEKSAESVLSIKEFYCLLENGWVESVAVRRTCMDRK